MTTELPDISGLAPEWRTIDTLIPYERNAKKHGEDQVRRIAASIKKYGWRGNPIIVNKEGVIIAGHGRRLAAISLGLEKVPVIEADMTEEEARAFRLADNRAAEGGVDQEVLRLELLDMPELTIADLGDVFDKKELEFASMDIMELNEGAFHDNLDTAMEAVDTGTTEKIAAAAEKDVSLAKALGIKSVKGAGVIYLTHFIALIASKYDLDPADALVAHAKETLELAQ